MVAAANGIKLASWLSTRPVFPVVAAGMLLSAARDYSFAGDRKVVTLRDDIKASPGFPRRGRNRRSPYAVVSIS